jgi:hypothetical protein
MTMMEPTNTHRLRGPVKVLSAVIGDSVVIAMGAVTVAYPGNESAQAQHAQMAGPRQQLPARRRRRRLIRPLLPRRSPLPHVRKG